MDRFGLWVNPGRIAVIERCKSLPDHQFHTLLILPGFGLKLQGWVGSAYRLDSLENLFLWVQLRLWLSVY